MNNNPRPDNARNFDDVDVQAYTQPTAPAPAYAPPTMAFESVPAVPTTIAPPAERPLAVPAAEATGYSEIPASQSMAGAELRRNDHRRGTIDFGLVFVRIALSSYLLITGLATFFGLGANPGLKGLETAYAAYRLPEVLAIAVPSLQLLAGVFLLIGLVTPVAAMLGCIVTGITALHAVAQAKLGLNVFAWPETVWLSMVLWFVAIGLQFTGPGLVSLDFARTWARRPLATSWIFVVVGGVALGAIAYFLIGVNPFARA